MNEKIEQVVYKIGIGNKKTDWITHAGLMLET